MKLVIFCFSRILKKIDGLEGTHAPELTKKVQRHASVGFFPPSADECLKDNLSPA